MFLPFFNIQPADISSENRHSYLGGGQFLKEISLLKELYDKMQGLSIWNNERGNWQFFSLRNAQQVKKVLIKQGKLVIFPKYPCKKE
jgi:hypothetical protein